MNETLVIIPTYNEAKNITKLINELKKINVDILIVDDNSPDNTSNLVKQNKSYGISIFVIDRLEKLGLGSAYRVGFSWAIEKEYKYIAQMDADFSHRIIDLLNLFKYKEKYGLVLGSRYVEGGKTEGWNKKRKTLSKYANKISTFLISSPVKDMTSGFRVYTNEALKKIDFMSTSTDGYSFQIEMLVKALDKRVDIKELPIVFEDREDGNSKFNSAIVFEAMFTLLRLSFRKFKGN